MNTVFFGTSKYCLPVLGALKPQLKLVITSLDKPVGRKQIRTPSATKAWALANGIEIASSLDSLPAGRQARSDIELGIVADYGQIIKPEEFNIPKLGTFNIHFSKLPEFRGPSPVQFTLLRGDKTAWVTIFKIEPTLDTGPILWQKEYPIGPDDTTESLYTRLFIEVAKELPKINFEGALTKQDHSKATFTRFLTRDDGFIPYSTYGDRHALPPVEIRKIYNQYRAMYPWPGLWTIKDGKRMKILKCHLNDNKLVIDLTQYEGEKARVDF